MARSSSSGHDTTSSCPTHAERLADHFQNTQLVWIDDSRTLIPIDQPKTLTDHLHTFLAAHA